MRQLLAWLLLLIFVRQLSAQRLPLTEPSVLAFTHVTIIDMTGTLPKSDMTVVVTGSRITALGQTGKIRIPKEAQGKIASFILLEANPLEDISNAGRINAVVVTGRFFPKTVLRMMLANVEKAANPR